MIYQDFREQGTNAKESETEFEDQDLEHLKHLSTQSMPELIHWILSSPNSGYFKQKYPELLDAINDYSDVQSMILEFVRKVIANEEKSQLKA